MARPRVKEAKASLPSEQTLLSTKLRNFRTLNQLTLEQVSRLTGVSVGTLCKLENNQIALRFETLAKLFNALDISMAGLETECPRPFARGERTINRPGSETLYETSTYEYRVLSDELVNKAIFPVLIVVKARSLDDFQEWNQHPGEAFIYVLSGAIRVYMEGREPVILRKGESIHFDSAIEHVIVSHSAADAVILSMSHGVTPIKAANLDQAPAKRAIRSAKAARAP